MKTPQAADALRVDHLAKDVERRAARGSAVTLLGQGLKFALQIASTALLARLLRPADYGLFGMASVFVGFAALLNDLGLNTVTVQREDITHEQVSALFWINLAFSFACSLVAAGTAPLVAWLYREPALVGIVLGVAPSLLISGAAAQHGAILTRQMRFRAIAFLDVASSAAGVAAAAAAALEGAGPYALVVLYTVQPLVRSVLIIALARWRPNSPRRVAGMSALLKFGGHLTATRVFAYLARNVDNALIGWYWNAATLGVYTRAYALFQAPLTSMLPALRQVVEPTLSRVQADRARLLQLHVQFEEVLAWMTMPLATVVLVGARPLVRVGLGPGWDEAVPVLQVLSLTAPLQPLVNSTSWLFVATGRGQTMLRWAIFSGLLHCALFGSAVAFGNVAMAAAFGVARLAVCAVGIPLATDRELGLARVLWGLRWPLGASFAGGLLATGALRGLPVSGSIVQLVVVTLGVYAVVAIALTTTGRLRMVRDLLIRPRNAAT